MVLLLDALGPPAAAGSSRSYLLETQVLPAVECGIEDMLRACTAAAESGERVDPINFLASYLMRNNPRHSQAASERLAGHQREKEAAAAKEAAESERLLAYEQAEPSLLTGGRFGLGPGVCGRCRGATTWTAPAAASAL